MNSVLPIPLRDWFASVVCLCSFSVGVVSAAPAIAGAQPDTVVTCDFSSGKVRRHSGMGSFEGPLPANCGDNFSGWMKGHVKTSLHEEDGFRFTRFATRDGSQFAIGGFDVTGPCYYRLIVKARSIADPIRFFLRMTGAPYKEYWSTSFQSPEWRERSYLIRIDKMDRKRCSVFFSTPPGECDIASVRLESASEADFTAGIRRPPAHIRRFFRHTRFPFGLPNGWNRLRESLEGTYVSEDNALKVVSAPVEKGAVAIPCGFWTEPIQTNEPDQPITFSCEYRSEGKWHCEARTDDGKWIAGNAFPPAATWTKRTFVVREPKTSAALALCVKGTGTFCLRHIDAWAGTDEPPVERAAEVALAPGPGEIAASTRIQFADERPLVRFKVLGAGNGAVLNARVTDLYGVTRPLPAVTLTADGAGVLDYGVFPERPLGQFRIDAVVSRDGQVASRVEELVMTRLARPVAWGRDAPDSPFGGHFLARTDTLALMKAAGVNWARFHDACTDLSGWAHLEPTRGTWQWRDREIARFRDRKIKIFAQLGTAPAWATHYGDLGCKRMGYFERYLRPTNDVDTVRYVKTFVARYKGVIDDYFIWNEPWGSWWSHAADIRYYDKDKAGYDFGVFSRLVCGAVKEAHPGASVCGYNTFTGETGRKWTAGVHSGGAYGACDAVDFHYYTTQRRCRPGSDARVTDAPFAPIRAEYPDLGGKPVYMTEGQGSSGGSSSDSGRLSGLYARTVPWQPETTAEMAQMADRTCRYVISLLAENVKRVYLYSSHCYTALAVRPSFLQLLAADGFPHASTVGFAQMARMLEGKRFVRVEKRGPEAGVYVFEGAAGTVRVFSGLTCDEACALKGATDVYGNPIARDSFLPDTLVYCVGNAKAE